MKTNIISTQRHKHRAKYILYYKPLYVIRMLFKDIDNKDNQEPEITVYDMPDEYSFNNSLYNLSDYDILNNEKGQALMDKYYPTFELEYL